MEESHTTEPNQTGGKPLPGGKDPSSVGWWNWNLETREYSWSDEMYRIFNLKPPYSPTRTGTFLNRVHPDDKQKVVIALGKALVGEQSYNIEHRIVWPEGEVRLIQGRATVRFNNVGIPILMLGTVQDITGLK